MDPTPPPSRARRLVGAAALGAVLLAAVPLADRYLNSPALPRPIDFLAFWAAGRLHLHGESPYDPEKVFALQLANRTSEGKPVVIWNPPWLLALLLPLGALPVNAAQVAWILGQMALIGAGVAALWRVYGGPGKGWVPAALVLGSGPFWWQAVCGQADGLVFAGLAGFLFFRHSNRPYLAGVAAALTAVKPHLLIVFAIGLGIDALRTRTGRQAVLGGLAALALAAAVATIPNPGIWADYFTAASGPGSEHYPKLSAWFNPTVGAWVRKAVPGDPFWVQLVPAAAAAAWFAAYWWRRGTPDRWAEVLPWAVPLGLLTPPYGSWPCDLVLLLLPAVAVAARLARESVPANRLTAPLAVYAAANLGVVAMLVTKQRQELYVWACPVIAGCLWWMARIAAASSRSAAVTSPGFVGEVAAEHAGGGMALPETERNHPHPNPPPALRGREQDGAPRRLLLVAGVLLILLCGGLVLDKLFRGGLPAPFDFTAFWIAGQLLTSGRNPYDPALIRPMQLALGMDDTAVVAWYPPWGLVPMMPLGFAPFRVAYGLWVLFHIGLMLVSAELLWRGLGGDPRRRWVAYLLALTFVPTAFLIGSGQTTAVVLFGLAGFAAARRAGRPYLAGALGALTATKPHLLALYAVWLLAEGCRTRDGRKVLLGGLAVGVLGCLLPTLANPHVWADYLRAVNAPTSAEHHNLADWTPPLVGWWLRQAVPGKPFWVQWVPILVAFAGFAVWYTKAHLAFTSPPALRGRGRRVFEPGEGADSQGGVTSPPHPDPLPCKAGGEGADPAPADPLAVFPWVVGLSLLAAPYGVWQHDLVLLLVPVFAVAVRLTGWPNSTAVAAGVGWLTAANLAMQAMMLAFASSEWYVWVVPTVLLGCWVTGLVAARSPAPRLVPGVVR